MLVKGSSGFDHKSETQNKILETALVLFNQKGFTSGTLREIAKRVGIRLSSVQYYYPTKDLLLEDIFSCFTKGYKLYFESLMQANSKAETIEDLMDNMFNKELIEMQNPMACLGMSLAIKEQHTYDSAYDCVSNLFYQYSIECLKSDFDRLIKNSVIPSCNTKAIARLFMFCIIASNDIRVHEFLGNPIPLDYLEIYSDLKEQIALLLLQEKE